MYSFYKLSGSSGFLKTVFRTVKAKFNPFNNLKVLFVDYSREFIGVNQDQNYFMYWYWLMRIKKLLVTLFDLGLLYGLVYLASHMFQKLLYHISMRGLMNTTLMNLLELVTITLLLRVIPYCLDTHNFPFSCQMIAYTCLLTHNFSIYCLQHSKYQLKYRFWMFICLFLNYYYFKTYPYCNVTLTNIVFMTFTLYQLSHNLFKFSFYFELMIIQLNRGNVAAYLQANI